MIRARRNMGLICLGPIAASLLGCGCPRPPVTPATDAVGHPAGIQVVDFAPPVVVSAEAAAPLKLRGDAVFQSGGLVLRGASGGLVVGEFTDGGTKLMEQGALYLPDAASDVVAVDSVAYVASGPQGVFVVDLTDPHAPVCHTRVMTAGAALRLERQGDLLLVANGTGGVVLLDISDRMHPVPRASWTAEGYVRHALFVEDGVLAALGFEGVVKLAEDGKGGFDIVWMTKTKGQARAIAPGKTEIFVADGPAGVTVLGPGEAEGFQVIGSFPLKDMARDVVLAEGSDRVFVAVGDDGIAVLDVSAPGNVTQTGSFVPEKPANRLRLDGARLLVGNDADGLLVLDVKSADTPRKVFPPEP